MPYLSRNHPNGTFKAHQPSTQRLGWIFLCSCAKQVIIIIITHWFFANLIRTRWWLNDYFFMWNYLETLRQQAITSVLHGWNSTKQSKSYGKQNYILRRITFAKFFKAFLQIKSSSIKLSRTFMSCQMLTEKWMLRVPKICQFICMLLYVCIRIPALNF